MPNRRALVHSVAFDPAAHARALVGLVVLLSGLALISGAGAEWLNAS